MQSKRNERAEEISKRITNMIQPQMKKEIWLEQKYEETFGKRNEIFLHLTEIVFI